MMHGYCGRLLRVDLAAGTVSDQPLRPEVARRYIGGSGLAAHLYLEEIAPKLEAGGHRPGRPAEYPDPLGPDNPLLVLTGPLTASRLPAASRWTVSARSPLTGIWGEANVGGYFGARLKTAGYDGIVVTGRAPRPVYLLVDAGAARLAPAGDIWGKDTYETDDVLGARHAEGDREAADEDEESGDARRAQVLAVGPAGENLVRFAAAVHGKHHVAGRAGMGAVMGSKNLKAMVVRGKAADVPAADPKGLAALRARLREAALGSQVAMTLKEAGTIVAIDLGAVTSDIPTRNWTVGDWGDETLKLGVGAYAEYLTGTTTCFACPVGCKRNVTVEALGRSLKNAPGASYETLASLGADLLVSDLPAVLVAGEACNRLGLDTISSGATLAYAYEAAERGLLREPRLAGAWGDGARLVELLRDIAFRRGVGADLAEGTERLARRIGRPEAASFLTTVKGLEAPMHDPRAVHSMGLAYATGCRGACHMSSLVFSVEYTGLAWPDAGVDLIEPAQSSAPGKGASVKAADELAAVFSQSAAICLLGGTIYDSASFLEALNATTGFGFTLDDVRRCGARIWNLKRGIGNLYGVTRKDDRLPARLLEAFKEGPAAGSVPDLKAMLDEWYQAWDLDENGRPRRETLGELGLERLAGLLGV